MPKLASSLLAMVLAGAAGPAVADSYCGAGRHVGAENDGAGQSWRCVSDGTRSSLPSVSSGGGDAGATLGAVAAGLDGLAALLSIVSQLGSRISATDATGPVRDSDNDAALAATRSRDLNRQAIASLQLGKFDRAADLFDKASFEALRAENRDEYEANLKNARIANAENMLRRGYDLEQKGDWAAASQYYMRGKQLAQDAQAGDLAGKLGAYNDRLVAKAGGATGGVKPTQSSCSRINGQLLCR